MSGIVVVGGMTLVVSFTLRESVDDAVFTSDADLVNDSVSVDDSEEDIVSVPPATVGDAVKVDVPVWSSVSVSVKGAVVVGGRESEKVEDLDSVNVSVSETDSEGVFDFRSVR